jgi:hypothetical protein
LIEWRTLVCGVMVFVVPTSLSAQDEGRAMLHSQAGASLNGSPAPISAAIFPQDTIQTQKDSTAKIDVEGSTVTLQPETTILFEPDEIALDHGSVELVTSREMRVRVNCITVIPAAQEWTRYDVTEVNGKVTVAAFQNDVKIHSRGAAVRRSKQRESSDTIVHQGEQITREEGCGAAAKPADTVAADGAFLNHPWVVATAAGVVGVLTCWALCRGDDPISPDKP